MGYQDHICDNCIHSLKHIDPAAIGALNCVGATMLCDQSDNSSKFRVAEG
jgi:hypothetical protein